MLDALIALPEMSLTLDDTGILRVVSVSARLIESGLDLPVELDSPERIHLSTSQWLELTCEAIAAGASQGLFAVGSDTTCAFTFGATQLTATRARILGWELRSTPTDVRERIVIRLESWTVLEGG